MPKTITEQNLRTLMDSLIKDGLRVVGPKQAGTMTLYEPLQNADELELAHLPRRSSKEVFFPVCENILSFRKDEDGQKVEGANFATFPETVLVGARPCDVAAVPVLDAIFSWDYQDEFFLERRRKTTIIGLSCTTADDACFCSAVGLSPSDTRGSDLFLTPLEGGGYVCETLTDKGKQLIDHYPGLFANDNGAKPVPAPAATGEKLDLARIKEWLNNNFEHPLWEGIAEHCAGCGACAFVCPACHCFDINDEGTVKTGERRKSWDACGFSKFTNHASGHNPRDLQNKRYRNRIMHKFKYYDDKFGQTLCTGCGRCIRACPVGIDIKEILDQITKHE
jgi:ferredoxin